ncbi:DUF6302 family protein [Streptomyces monashensis]|uniref:DUF6302 family protein n=1 Tax=Streptomyces monashensis TaxID=1678012 RepID=UPI0033D625BE
MNLRAHSSDQNTRTPGPLTVEILPAHEAYDYEFAAARLHDRALLADSVAVRIFRAPLLAIPVGACRRGGRIDVGPVTVALAVRSALLGRPGFPLLRVSLSRDAHGESWLVEWGERAPDRSSSDSERRRFFGYPAPSDAADCPQPPPVYHASTGGCGPPAHQRVPDVRDEPVRRAPDEERHVPA